MSVQTLAIRSKYFSVKQGQYEIDAMASTRDFITQNTDFVHSHVMELQKALGVDGPVTFISCEPNWTTAVSVESSELGRISSASGAFIEGPQSSFDEIIGVLHQAPATS